VQLPPGNWFAPPVPTASLPPLPLRLRRTSAVETRLAASLSDSGNLPKDSVFAELSGFVSGHRFSDAATRQLLTAPLGAKGRESKLRKLSTIVLTLIVFAAAAALAGESSSNSNNQLPAGPMQEKAVAAWSTCHESRIILQQRLSKMIKWGAEVDPRDRDALIDYFSANFGPDPPAYAAPRSATQSASQTKAKK
jgi:hypothetical protein